VGLGRSQPINEALRRWLPTLQRRFRTEADDRLAAEVRRLIWAPLERHIGDARLLLISPDGLLIRVPWGALPGKKTGAYLIEVRAVATVPVPYALPEVAV